MLEGIYLITLVGTLLVLVAAFSSLLAFRFGAPLLLLFLGIGLGAGVIALGISFDNAGVAYFIGSLALAVILFDSGFGTSIQSFRQAAGPAITLATLGVVLTAGFFGLFAHYVIGLPLLESLLLGAIVGSTDAAAVFFLLRIGGILRRAMPSPQPVVEAVKFGDFHFHISRLELKKGEEVVRLTDREKEMLRVLSVKPGETVPRYDLAAPGGDINERTVDVQVNRLRRKIEVDPANPLHLQTVRGIGYRLIATP